MTVPKDYSIKRVANIRLDELRKYDWWRRYEARTNIPPYRGVGRVTQPRSAVINGLKTIFPEWDKHPTFNFHWDKKNQFENIKLYVHVPKVIQRVQINDSSERQGNVPVVSNAVLRTPPVLD